MLGILPSSPFGEYSELTFLTLVSGIELSSFFKKACTLRLKDNFDTVVFLVS
jgi:hypothetical protein